MAKKNRNKFEFGTDFQELILQHTVTDQKGFKLLDLYQDTYFDLIHHSVVAYGLKKYYKKYKQIPELAYLSEFLRTLYQTDAKNLRDLTPADKELVTNTLDRIYAGPVKNPNQIEEKCINFARYVNFKYAMEDVDINNYTSWESSIGKLKQANSIGSEIQENYGTFLVGGMPDRAHKRDISHMVCPTPFWQFNQLLNSGGTEKGNVICFLSKEKFFKTGALINVARGYLKHRKKGFYVDLENGESAIVTRTEQSVSNREQKDIQSGDLDNHLLKLMRKYKRIGAEMVVKRFPNLKTSCNDIQAWLDKLRLDFGFVPDFGIIDYGLLLAANSGQQKETERVSEAFLDLKNLAEQNKLDCLWTAAHTTREGNKRAPFQFQSTDIAKCMDITKHIDALIGLQQNDDEEKANVLRMEVIEQRNGMRSGKIMFWMDIPKQRLTEFTHKQVKEYRNQEVKVEGREKKKRKTDL